MTKHIDTSIFPRHIAIIMDGNGRWAKQRYLPRVAGHKAGANRVRDIVEDCVKKQIEVLTLFAFSSENWSRPAKEVKFLMSLFISLLQREVKNLHKQNVQLHVVGDRLLLNEKLRKHITAAEQLTASNTGLKLVIAANYGGRWDISQAIRQIAAEVESGMISSKDITIDTIQEKMTLANFPAPDLLIRTSGEQRLSNFMLWQLAHSQLYFTRALWPDFSSEELNKALVFFSNHR